MAGVQKAGEEAPMGLVKIHKLPVLGEKGGGVGGGAAGVDLAFTVTRRRFEIKAWSLPPAEEGVDHSDAGGEHAHGGKTKVDVEF